MPDGVSVLIVAESNEGALATISAELAGVGRRLADELGGTLAALLVGVDLQPLAVELGRLGVDRVLVADAPTLANYEGGSHAGVAEAAALQAKPAVVLLGQTPNGRDLAARLAFRLQTGLGTDCTALRLEDGLLVMTKPVYGGSALAELANPDARPQMATIRPRAFEAVEPTDARAAEIVPLDPPASSGSVRVLETVKEVSSSGPRLKDAKVVVTGGRGLGGPDNWHVIEELAAPLDAAVGATRAVTDAGWVSPSLQVGLTGITISPDLYITVAVSGAVQHMAGCSGARNLVAINRDPEANIFKHARYGVVGDWKQVLPAFTARVKTLRER
jgi:electron transfer flavoprotein alpha subunit